jgi:hypothetical protein
MSRAIVTWDERRQGYEEGEVLDLDVKVRRELRDEPLFALPAEPELLARGPVSGFFMRKLGQGVELARMEQRRVAPMLLFAHPDFRFLHWQALVCPLRSEREVRGTLRLVAAAHGASAFQGGLAATGTGTELDLAGVPRLPSGGWVVGGAAEVSCTVEGYLGLELLAQADACFVAWSAVSQSARRELL